METEEIKNKIENNDSFAIRCLMKLYQKQTTDEQDIGATVEYNNVGFNGVDSEILSSFARQVEQWKEDKKYPTPLSPKQMALVKKKLPKYAGQLENMLEPTDINIQDYEKKESKSGETIKGIVDKVSEIKQYRYDKLKFFVKVESQKHGTIKTMIEVDDMEKPTRDIPDVGDTIEFRARVNEKGWANVSLKQQYAIIIKDKETKNAEITNKIKTIRKYLNELKSDDIISVSFYNKVWDTMNKLENEVVKNINTKSTETDSDNETKQETLDTTNERQQPPKKHNKGLAELLDEFEN